MVSRPTSPTVQRLLQRVATHGLDGRDERIATEPVSASDFPQLLRLARSQRLAGLLHAAVEDGALPASDEQRLAVDELHASACASVLQLERRLLDVAAALDRDGVPFVVLKGSAVAHLDYPDPALRMFGDVDLLFESDTFEHALETLAGLGYVRVSPEPGPGFDRWFGKGATMRGETGDELDTHRSLVFGTFGFAIELDELFRSAQTFELGGRRLPALGPETRLLHACYHAALGDPRPRYSSLRDVAQMLTRGDRDPARVLELSRRWQADAVLARAFHLCGEFLGYPVHGRVVEAVAAHTPTRRERRAIASFVGANRTYAAKVIASLPYLPGVSAKLRFLRTVARPDPEFVEVRGVESGAAWVRRGVRSAWGREAR